MKHIEIYDENGNLIQQVDSNMTAVIAVTDDGTQIIHAMEGPAIDAARFYDGLRTELNQTKEILESETPGLIEWFDHMEKLHRAKQTVEGLLKDLIADVGIENLNVEGLPDELVEQLYQLLDEDEDEGEDNELAELGDSLKFEVDPKLFEVLGKFKDGGDAN